MAQIIFIIMDVGRGVIRMRGQGKMRDDTDEDLP
jgi:hypothetical protein